jgi:lambda family phage portal protein
MSMVDGVELDSDGVPVAYHFCSRHPDDMGRGGSGEWRRYDVGMSATGTPMILHLYRQMRPDQVRGAPFLSPVIDALKQLGDYADAEIRAAVISAMFTVFIKQETPEDGQNSIVGTNDATANVDPKTEIQLGNGAIVDLGPGEEPVFADPTRPNPAFDAFVKATCRHIGVALEIPIELLLKSFGTSYSASRAALEMAWQMFRSRRSWLAWNFCQPVYEWVITEAVASGRLAAPGFFSDPIVREAWLGSDWIGPARIQLDPQKEASADLIDIGMGTKTRQQVILERTGGDFVTKHLQLAKEQKMRDADGLSTPASKSEALQPKESRQSGKPGAEDPDDETDSETEEETP